MAARLVSEGVKVPPDYVVLQWNKMRGLCTMLEVVLLLLLSSDVVFVNSNLSNSETDGDVADNLHPPDTADPVTDREECLTALKNNLYKPHNLSSPCKYFMHCQ